MSPRREPGPSSLINAARLHDEMERAGLDAVIACAPENTQYLSGVFIRTQVSIRERLAVVVWPREGEPVFIVCNIEESLARAQGGIEDVRTYVEFARSPIQALVEVLRERGLAASRLGVESRFLSAHYHQELAESLGIRLVPADALLERTRAIKTPGETERITDCFLKTEAAIRAAWAASRAGDTEKQVGDRMIEEITKRGATSLRHITLAAGENTIHPHMYPSARRLRPGDTVLTDFGGTWDGFSSDMARMGVVGKADPKQRDEYRRYREAYVKTIDYLRPDVSAADVFRRCAAAFKESGIALTAPHVGHSVSRGGGHENPMLHPFNEQRLEADMLIALEPTFQASADRRYHIEDLIQITERGHRVLTDWESTDEMITIPG